MGEILDFPTPEGSMFCGTCERNIPITQWNSHVANCVVPNGAEADF